MSQEYCAPSRSARDACLVFATGGGSESVHCALPVDLDWATDTPETIPAGSQGWALPAGTPSVDSQHATWLLVVFVGSAAADHPIYLIDQSQTPNIGTLLAADGVTSDWFVWGRLINGRLESVMPFASSGGLPPGTLGDLLVYGVSGWGLLPPGTDGYVLTMVDGVPAWARACCDPGCFASGATLTLLAGGTIGDTSYTDGPLGTNTTNAPFAMAINPADGLLYFNDGGSTLRTMDLTSGDVATSAFANHFASGNLQIWHSGIVFDADGLCYQWGVLNSDTQSSVMVRYLADGTFDTQLMNPASSLPIYTDDSTSYDAYPFIGPGALGISPDGTRIYFCGAYSLKDDQGVNGTTGFIGYWDVAGAKARFLAGVINPISFDPSAYPSPTIGGSGAPSGTGQTDQGEGTPGYQALVGNVVGLCVDPATGIVYSVANDVTLVRKIAADGSTVDSLSDHGYIPFSDGGSPGTWPSSFNFFGGDGSPAFSGEDDSSSNQMSFAQSICLTDCGGQLIVDNGNQVIRHIDTDGNLSTVAGDSTLSGMPYPTSTPTDALTCQIRPATILQVGGGKYLISQVGDGDTIPDALYLLQDGS